jgi:hypothetical protein
MNTIQRKMTRRTGLAVVTALVLAAQVAIYAVAATPAAAAPPQTMRRTVSPYEAPNSYWRKTAYAACPDPYLATGGGANIYGGNGQVRLTRLQPVHNPPLNADGYAATAEEPDTGYAGDWRLEAYAVCVGPGRVPGYVETFPRAETDASSKDFQTISAPCPGNKRVIGTGAAIEHANGQVGLNLVRSDGPLLGARASGREDADGYAQDWSLEVTVVCADRIESAAVYGTVLTPGTSGGSIGCPPDKFVYSVGAGGGLVDTGPYHLWASYPNSDLTRVTLRMTGPPAGGPAIGAICAF